MMEQRAVPGSQVKKETKFKDPNVVVDNTHEDDDDHVAVRFDKSPKKDPHMESLGIKRFSSSRDLSKEIHRILHEKTNQKLQFGEIIDEETAVQKFTQLIQTYIPVDVDTIQRKIVDHTEYTLAKDRMQFDRPTAYQSTAYSVRDRLIEHWNDTNLFWSEHNPKRVFYLSIEFLLGRSLQNALINLNIEGPYREAIKELGHHMEDLYDQEADPGLGNGGLGRLAACYLDALTTQNFPAWGYGIRYDYGMFRQMIINGWQVETPDFWLKESNPWEVPRIDVKYPVNFYGHATQWTDDKGWVYHGWEAGETVLAMAYDTVIPGFRTNNTNTLRLWASEPTNEFDLSLFNQGNYYKAIEKQQSAALISSVLYPNDNNPEGKELRFKQQYFFCSATLQDIMRRFRKTNKVFENFADKVVIQLNDTHPTIAIVELFRLLLDVEGLSWDQAMQITNKTFAYTNHTVLPEALEKWPLDMVSRVLPRHIEIIFEINRLFLEQVEKRWPGDDERKRKLSIIDEHSPKSVRMAHLAIVMCFKVNGVAAIHSEILKNSLFRDFYEMYPDKFINITNGITPRRWLLNCNPELVNIISRKLGNDDWLTNLEQLEKLKAHCDDRSLQAEWMVAKLTAKKRLAEWLETNMNIHVDPNALFDIQIKRIHEYKRQLMNILRIIYYYLDLKRKVVLSDTIVPRVIIFAGKAAPGYHKAKLIIKLINSVAEKINSDKKIKDLLKVVYIPNYGVSLAELIIPASDISQHISTAGMEASGTSNMKFALNGGLIVGTHDGANIEIAEAIGQENMFTFGLKADKVEARRKQNATTTEIEDPHLQDALDAIDAGMFGPREYFVDIINALVPAHDYYLIAADFASYLDALKKVDKTFQNKSQWARMSIISTACMGRFSSDRAVTEYAEKIWNVKPLKMPMRE